MTMKRAYERCKGGRPEAEWDWFVIQSLFDKPIIEEVIVLEEHDVDRVLEFLNTKTRKELEDVVVKGHHNYGAREGLEIPAGEFLKKIAADEMMFGR